MKHSFVEQTPVSAESWGLPSSWVDPPEEWQTAWAFKTMDVIGVIHYWAGSWGYYQRDPMAYEDLRGWLTEKAQETANRYEPKRAADPATRWAAYLNSTLKTVVKWHWADYMKAGQGSSKRKHLETHGSDDSIDRMLTVTAEGMARSETGMHGFWHNSDATGNPEGYMLTMESLNAALRHAERLPQSHWSTPPSVCTEFGCMGKVDARGLCNKHYQQAMVVQRPDLPRYRVDNSGTCITEGCETKAYTMLLCNVHYMAKKEAEAEPCTVDGCERGQAAKGLCRMHHSRLSRTGSLEQRRPGIPAKVRVSCAVEECERDERSSEGYCSMHYKRWKKHGDPLVGAKVEAGTCKIEGCQKVTYGRGFCQQHYGRDAYQRRRATAA